MLDVLAGGAAPIVNFGDTAGSLAALVYNDSNSDGVRNAGEPPIAGVALRLSGTDVHGNAVDLTAVTNSAGQYVFTDLPAGTYTLTETQPANFGDGADVAGSAGGTVGNDTISAIALGAAVDATGYAFGERGASGTIAGTVWRDVNHDRARGSDETALSGWTVELYQSSLLRALGDNQFERAVSVRRCRAGQRLRSPVPRAVERRRLRQARDE